MQRELRWILAASAALALGVLMAKPYARLAVPYYQAVAKLVARFHPWQVVSVGVQPGSSRLGAEVQLRGEVRRIPEQSRPSAIVVGRVQVGEVVETPIVYWTMVIMWPVASKRLGWLRAAAALSVFLALEALTTATQLILPMAQASAMLDGSQNPLTWWDRWSRFLEAGGQFVIAAAAAIVVTAWRRQPAAIPSATA
jgi:hypothetical protein